MPDTLGSIAPAVRITPATAPVIGTGPAAISLLAELDSHWQPVTDATLGYYIHKGTVYLTGAVQPNLSATGSFRAIYSGLPEAIWPAAGQHLTLPLIRDGMPLINDPGLSVPTQLAATVNPDGTLTLDAELPTFFVTAPSSSTYWYYKVDSNITSPTVEPRYPQPIQCQMVLGNASWPIGAAPDTFTPASLAAYLDAEVSDSGSGFFVHQERNHLAGGVTVNTIKQDTSSATPTDPVIVTDSLSADMTPGGDGGFAITTVHRDGELWVAEVNGGQVNLPQPFNWGTPPSGHSPWLVNSNPAAPPGDPAYDTDPYNRNYVGFTSGLGVGLVDGGLSGVYSVPDGTNLDLHATFDVDALLAMVAPTPDWFALTLFLTYNLTHVDVGGFISAFSTVGAINVTGPVTAVAHMASDVQRGFIAPSTGSYSGSAFTPPWTGMGPWPFAGGGSGGWTTVDPSWLWKTSDWPGGTIDVHPYVPAGDYFYYADIQYCGMGIIPFWEMPSAGFVASGENIDLTGTGWEGVTGGALTPSIIHAGPASSGLLKGRDVLGSIGLSARPITS